MVTSCIAFGCTYRHKSGNGIGMHRFPRNPVRCNQWIIAIKRHNWMPTDASRICGQHFQTGKPSRDKDHPDYVPNIFAYSRKKPTTRQYERKKSTIERKESRKHSVMSSVLVNQDPVHENLALPVDVMSVNENVDSIVDVTSVDEHADLHVDIASESENRSEPRGEREKALLKELACLQAVIAEQEAKLIKTDPKYSILSDEKTLSFYTGMPSLFAFNWLNKIMSKELNNGVLPNDTQLLIVLMKLKLNLCAQDLAYRFNVSSGTIQHIFDIWIPALGGKLKSLIRWPSRKALKKYMPDCFRTSDYKNTVCIIDCMEVQIQRPSTQEARAQTWSNCKSFHSIKFLIAITPSGHICFLSEAWGGHASDKEITLQCGFMDKISKNDIILADRGFILNDHFSAKGAILIVPAFTRGQKQLSKQDINYSKRVYNVWLHVERVICLIKKYQILHSVIPITFLKYIDSVLVICAALCNLSPSVVKKEDYNSED